MQQHTGILTVKSNSISLLRETAIVISASFAIALLAQIAVPLPFTPVPVTMQTLGVFLAAALLGARRGTLAVITYIAEGAAGLPFFAGGSFGIIKLIGPTGGYLAGFVIAAFAVGLLSERGWTKSIPRIAVMYLLGTAAIYGLGLMHLSRFVPANQLVAAGFAPFMLGEMFKLSLAISIMPLAGKFLGSK